MLRTNDEKQEILSRLEPTKRYQNVVPQDLMEDLKSAWKSGPKNQKNTGPLTYDYYPNKEEHYDWWKKTDEFVTKYVGEHETFATNFYEVTHPHILHNDDSLRWVPRLHKTVVFPLEISKPTKFAVFDQCYLDGPVKLRHGGDPNKNPNIRNVYYNKNLMDNSGLINYTGEPFDRDTWEEHFTHLPYKRFTGLSIECIVEWNPGDIIIFDTARIHCACDFTAQGIERKLGYSVFTALEKNDI